VLRKSIAANHYRLVQETSNLQLGLQRLKTHFEFLVVPEQNLQILADLQNLDLRILDLREAELPDRLPRNICQSA
jgi:hypothetical protein